jgi:hypothetical protein
MHVDIPAIEIALGETFREASQAVDDWAHFRLRVAIGRRSMCSVAGSFIVELKSIAGPENNTQMKAWEPHVPLIAGLAARHPEQSEGPHNRSFGYTKFLA